MASQLRRAVPLMEYLHSLNTKGRTKFIKNMNDNVLKLIIDVLYNINIGTIPLDASLVQRLRKYKKQIKSITVSKKSLARRRQELQAKDLFFTKIIPLLLPVLIRMIVPKTPENLQRSDNDDDGVQSSNAPPRQSETDVVN